MRDKNFANVCKIKAYIWSNRIDSKLTTVEKTRELLKPVPSRHDKKKMETKKCSWKWWIRLRCRLCLHIHKWVDYGHTVNKTSPNLVYRQYQVHWSHLSCQKQYTHRNVTVWKDNKKDIIMTSLGTSLGISRSCLKYQVMKPRGWHGKDLSLGNWYGHLSNCLWDSNFHCWRKPQVQEGRYTKI